MITLTKSNARERCRTCLRKLLKDGEHLDDMNVETSLSSKFVDISTNKKFQEMIEKYVNIDSHSNVDLCNHHSYPQYLCIECLKHLQTFETFVRKALDSARKLYIVFSDNCHHTTIDINDDGTECKNNAYHDVSNNVKNDIFDLLLKDSLMETEAITLERTSLDDFNNTEPDPFQITQSHDNIKRKRAKRDKTNSLSNTNTMKRKLKKYLNTEVNKPLNDNNNIEIIACYTLDSKIQEEGDSSEDEALSKEVQHSEKEIRENTKKKIESEINLVESLNRKNNKNIGLKLINKKELMKNTLGILKTEEEDNVSNDTNFDLKDNAQTVKMREKKKRHYILNSGRKKGLANRYKCDQCQHKFGHKLTLDAHVRKIHEGQKKAFKCQLCDKAYSFIGGLSTHIKDVHERKQDSYDCNVVGCDKKYSNFITLQRHVRLKHLNIEAPHQYVCEQCGATFKQSSNLRYHMKTRHPTEEDLKRKQLLPKERLECEECKKLFHSQYTLKYHKLRVHAAEKKFECKICGRRVAKQFMLDSHMLVHSDQKLACKFCGREFVRKYQVEAHIRAVHQKLKPFQCPHCSESFASRKTLRHHIYIHTGEKPYVCDICGQSYRQPTCLKNHRKIHNKTSTNNVATASNNQNFINNFRQSNNDTLINTDDGTI
ncbi:uncharacterized protein ACRADG_006589 [Cochliomyia hominivorax]